METIQREIMIQQKKSDLFNRLSHKIIKIRLIGIAVDRYKKIHIRQRHID